MISLSFILILYSSSKLYKSFSSTRKIFNKSTSLSSRLIHIIIFRYKWSKSYESWFVLQVRPHQLDLTGREKSLNVTTPSSYFAVTDTSVIIIRWQKVTPRGAHYEFHKLWGRPRRVILNNRYMKAAFI